VIVDLCTTRKCIKKIIHKNGGQKYGDYGILVGKILRNSCGNIIQRLLLVAWGFLELTYFKARELIPR
jgi:hypothetical protein